MAADDSEQFVLLNQLAEEFAARYRRGERPALQEYIDRHPELADDIREFFPAVAAMEQAKDDRQEVAEPTAAGPLPPLERLGDFRILREIGHGGMGVVYEAEQVSLGRHVALKVLPKQLLADARTKRRFDREARAAARLHHTNIVPVFGVGEHEGLPYYVMQFIPGLGLDEVLVELQRLQSDMPEGSSTLGLTGRELRVSRKDVSAAAVARSLLIGRFTSAVDEAVGEDSDPAAPEDGPAAQGDATAAATSANAAGSAHETPPAGRLSDTSSLMSSSAVLPGTGRQSGRKPLTYWQSVARVGVQAADALEYAHRQGVLHRDIKPSNLLLDTTGTVWVTDFGLAKADDQQNLTHTGDVLGTLRYMPPEAFDGKADARGDVYALGLTLYELLAFRPAFDERDRNRLIKQVTTAEPARLDRLNREVPRDLVTIVHKAIDRDLARRYPSAGELEADLQRFLADEPIKARRQTTAETAWRWARRNKAVATLLTVVGLLVVTLTVGALAAAAYFREGEKVQRRLVQAKAALAERNQQLAEENAAATKTADDARKQAETTLVDMQTSRGLLAGERDDPARAVLWFARAAEQAASDPTRQADSRRRARNWARAVTVPLRAFPLKGTVSVMEFRNGGDLLLLLADARLFVRDWRADEFLHWGDDLHNVGAACWSPDGERLAIGYNSGNVQIRGVPEGRVLHEMKVPGAITALAFGPNGHLAIAATEVRDWRKSPTVLPWDLVERPIPTLVGETAVRLWDGPSHALLPTGWEHPAPVHSLAFNRAGNRLITACTDRKARVFAVPGGADRTAPLFDPIPHQPRFPWPPAFIDGDRRLVTVSLYHGRNANRPTELTCWDAETGKPAGAGVIRARPSFTPRVVASPQGDWFATCGHFGPEMWKTADTGTKSVYSHDHTGYVQDLVPGPDGKTLLSASWDQTARLWSVPDGKSLGSPLPHMGIVTRCAVASDNVHLATFAAELVRVWKRSEGDAADVQPANWLGTTRPSFDGLLIAPGIWHEQPNLFAPVGSGKLVVSSAVTGTPAGPAIALPGQLVDSCVCADNRTAAAVSVAERGAWLSLHDVSTGQALVGPKELPGPPRSVAARPSSPHVAVLCAGGELLVFDSRSGELVRELNHDGLPAARRTARVAYTPDGATLVSLVGDSDTIYVRDAQAGGRRCPPIRPGPEGDPCRAFALSADSRLLATAVNGKNAAQVWELATGRALSQPLSHPGDLYGIFCLCFSPDGRRLLTGCKDGQARLWDWQAGTLVCPPLKHENEVHAVAMSPDGRYALTAGRLQAGKLHVWELATGKLIAPPVPLAPNVASLWCSPDASRVVASPAGVVARVDLAKLLGPPDLSTEGYRLLGELASGQRIEHGEESGLTQQEWLDRLREFNQLQAAGGAVPPGKKDESAK